jgi:hypothetical protein
MQTQSDLSRAAFKVEHGQDAGNRTFLTGPQVQGRYQKSHVTIWRWVKDADLGSGLIDHIQKMTIAAMAIADMKVWAQRS